MFEWGALKPCPGNSSARFLICFNSLELTYRCRDRPVNVETFPGGKTGAFKHLPKMAFDLAEAQGDVLSFQGVMKFSNGINGLPNLSRSWLRH